MGKLPITSQITFLYFEDMPEARRFFDEALELERVHDTGWAAIWRTDAGAFVGAVDATQGSIRVESRGGVMLSLCVSDIERSYTLLEGKGLAGLTPIRQVKDMALRSFFFTGPEGYAFEVQQFTGAATAALF